MNFLNDLLELFTNVISNGVFGISLVDYGLIISSIIFSLLIRGLTAKLLVKKIKKIVINTNNKIDDKLFEALIPPLKLLPIVVVFLLITIYFDLGSTTSQYFNKINTTLSTIFVFWFIHQSLIPFAAYIHKLQEFLSKALYLWLIKSLKYLVIFLGIVAVLEVWGIKIGPVIAGLGLFGVAVALGAQDLFKNLISGIMILLETRFQIGDVINVPGHTEGTVEHIGFRSTLIRKFDSTPITIPNYIFAEAPILNYTNRNYRRINWTIGLEYNSTLDQIKKLTEMISTYFKENDDFMVDDNYKSFVRIEKFNDSSIDILVICFTSTKDWDKYLQIKEELAMEIKANVEKIGLNFAFPSQSIYIEKTQNL